jgi:putative transposase
MHLLLSGREYKIEQYLPNSEIQIKDITTNEFTSRPKSSLIEALFNGSAELLGCNHEYTHLQLKQAESLVSDFTALDINDPRKTEAKRRLEYIKEIEAQGLTQFGRNACGLKPIIEKASKLIVDNSPPSCSALRRWYKDYLSSGKDIRALIPSTRARGNKEERISKDKEKCGTLGKIFDDVINEEYLTLERPTVQTIYDSIMARIAKMNQFRDKDDKLPIPHRNTVYRAVNKLDPYEKDKARWGKRIADLRHKANKQGARPTRPLERVEIDDTKLDLFVVDPIRMMPIGRPWLMLAIDVYTKMILGFYLSFFRPSYLSVMQCLLHSIRPKTYVRGRYPEIKHSWEAFGVPELVVVDNAKQYYSASFEDACLQLGIATQYAPVKLAYYKPSVERFFGTQNRRLLHGMPGTTFSNIFQKGDYNPKKNAIISTETLEQIIHNWVIDIYQQSKHRGIDDVPARRWEIGVDKFPPALPSNSEELKVLLGHIEWRVISPSGVELFGLYYNDDSLALLRTHAKKGEKFKIKYDPTDLSLIYVYDEHNNRYLAVPAVDQDYTKGLTLWQHNVIRRFARQQTDDYVDMVELCLAKDRIHEIVRESCGKNGKSAANVNTNLWLNPTQRNYPHTVEHGVDSKDRKIKTEDEPSTKPSLLTPGNHPAEGISNLSSGFVTEVNAVPHEGEIIRPSVEEIGKHSAQEQTNQAVQGKGNNNVSTNKRNPKRGTAQQKALANDAVSSATDNPVGPQVISESDLDMAGWVYDYELPKKER